MSTPATAQPTEAPTRDLLVDPARLAGWLRERDALVDAAHERVAAARALQRQTHVLPNPQLTVAAGDFVIGKTTTGDDGIDRHLGLGQTTIFNFGLTELLEIGKREPRQRAAELRVREAGETAVAALGLRLGTATSTLGKLVYLVAKRDAVASNLAAATRLRDNEKIRVDNKDLSPLEFERIELDVQEVALQLARAEAELAGTAASCEAILHAPCSRGGLDGMLDAAAPLPPHLPEPQAAIEARAVRAASRLEAGALGWDARLAANRRLPDLTVGIGYVFDNLTVSGDQHQTLAFTLEMPLPLFDRGNHDAAAARASALAIQAEDRAEVSEARGVVDGLVAQHGALTRMLQQLETESVPKSSQIIAQTRKAFDLGQARLADLLLVERSHRDLLLEVLDTRFALFDVRTQLREALGLDDEIARSIERSRP